MPAETSKRVLWKGAISFGLVHIPIALHSAVQNLSVDFDWLDRRSMEPVGYKRINKVTGEDIERENIVKGIKLEDDEYVVLEPDEIASAYPRTTQTVEIEVFVPLDAIPFVYLERPYYIAPINKGGKVYGLLREVLAESRLAGLAKVVIQTKQHLAILFACGPVLILNLMRWGDEVRDWGALNLPSQNKKELGLSEKELDMARQLVSDMQIDWEPERFTDTFREQIMQLVQEKVEAGETSQVTQPESEEPESGGARIYDLTEMLQRSLKGRGSSQSAAKGKEDAGENEQGSETSESDGSRNRKSAGKATKTAKVSKVASARKGATAKQGGAAAKQGTAAKASKSTRSSSSTASKSGKAAKSATAAKSTKAAKSSKTTTRTASKAGKSASKSTAASKSSSAGKRRAA